MLKIDGKDTSHLTHLDEGCVWFCLLMSPVTGDTGGLIEVFCRNKNRLVGPTTVKPFTLYRLRRRQKDYVYIILSPVHSKS